MRFPCDVAVRLVFVDPPMHLPFLQSFSFSHLPRLFFRRSPSPVSRAAALDSGNRVFSPQARIVLRFFPPSPGFCLPTRRGLSLPREPIVLSIFLIVVLPPPVVVSFSAWCQSRTLFRSATFL